MRMVLSIQKIQGMNVYRIARTFLLYWKRPLQQYTVHRHISLVFSIFCVLFVCITLER